ncbi:ABC transporter substrate-binding protein [Clostridium thermarum]|uniref:ABC transporter substrate-binding protein n=1 Tax=Clostridium thermarum TaxID=1716543 RepID=UPI0013D6EA3E|nr:extracellular solute-binding protein [Clostridium thermarum]
MRISKLKSVMIFIIMIITIFNTAACARKSKGSSEGENKQKLNAYIEVKDRGTLDIIRTFLDDYQKEKKDVEITFNSPLGENKLEEDIVKGSIDILVVSREKMIELSKKGLLKEMGDFYSKNNISDKYYNIMGAYGRIGDKYFGIGIMPNTVEVIYNQEALSKLNIAPPEDMKALMETVKKLTDTGSKVPVLLAEEVEIKNIVPAVIVSNTMDASKIETAFGCSNEGYSKVPFQQVFDSLYNIVKQGYVKEDTFEAATESTIQRVIVGDVPVMIAVSNVTKEMKEAKLNILKDYNISETKNNIPVLVNAVISTPANSKNEEAVNELLEFMYDEKTQKKLAESGYVTANKAVNEELWKEGLQKDIADHLQRADSNSIFYLHNFPEKLHPYIESAVINILKGKYTGKEWEEIINKACKQE